MEGRQLVAAGELRDALIAFKVSADRSAKWMLRLTITIAGLTVVLAFLTLLVVLRAG